MASNPLSPHVILQGMADALPTHEKGDTTSDMSSSYEAVALFTHACMSSLGFRLVGFHEDQKIGKLPAVYIVGRTQQWRFSTNRRFGSSESECQQLAPRLPSKWNASFNSHSFVYAHTQSSMQYVIRVDRLGGKAEIRGLGVGDERIARVEITARDYVSSSALPLRISTNQDGTEDRSDLPQKLKSVFISEERISDLASLLKVNIIQKLLPSLQKEGYEESNNPDDRAAREDADRVDRQGGRRGPPEIPEGLPDPARPNPYPFNDPLAEPPRRPIPAGDFPPPGFEDEYEINRPPRGPLAPPGGFGGRHPFNIGDSDLNPPGLGPHDPLRGAFIPGGGLPRPGGGGMHPTFDDPLFRGPHGQGDEDFNPQAPPGARWDPLGPGGGGPRFGGGRPGNSFGGNDPFGGGGII